VHPFCGTEDRIHWARRQAKCTTDATGFVYHGANARLVFAIFSVKGFGWNIEQGRQCRDCYIAARRALINVALPVHDGFGVQPAARVAALATLGLRQPGVDLAD
jgi:hypothetical protein